MKKIVIFLVVVIIFNLGIGFSEVGQSKIFVDVNPDDWYYDVLALLYEEGHINGYKDNTFRPNENIKIIEFISLIDRMMGYKIDDKEYDYWGGPYIEAALVNGIIEAEDFIDYNDNITRGQAITIIYNAMDYKAVDTSRVNLEFVDIDALTQDELTIVSALYEENILNGYEDKTLRWTTNITRAECIKLAYEMINSLKISEEENMTEDVEENSTVEDHTEDVGI